MVPWPHCWPVSPFNDSPFDDLPRLLRLLLLYGCVHWLESRERAIAVATKADDISSQQWSCDCSDFGNACGQKHGSGRTSDREKSERRLSDRSELPEPYDQPVTFSLHQAVTNSAMTLTNSSYISWKCASPLIFGLAEMHQT